MFDVVITQDARAFFGLSDRAGYFPKERDYIRRCFMLGSHRGAYIAAMGENGIAARLMTWTDRAYTEATGQRLGFFALLDGDARAFRALLTHMERLQLEWGSTRIVGPIAPDGSGWFMGQCDRPVLIGARGQMSGPGDRGQTRALTEAGYLTDTTFGAFRIKVPGENKFKHSAERLASRMGLRTIRDGINPFGQTLSRAVYELSPDNKTEAALRLERLSPLVSKAHSFAISDASGSFTGYAISLKGAPLYRIATIMTKEGKYRKVSAALLASKLIDSYMASGHGEVELSVIDALNIDSNRLVTNLGSVHDRDYILYYKILT